MGGWCWWLLRGGWALRLTAEGYAVRLLRGVGVGRSTWSDVSQATATHLSGVPCLVITLADGRTTRLPMAVLAADRDVVAHDVRRRLRDAHTPGAPGAADSAEPSESL